MGKKETPARKATTLSPYEIQKGLEETAYRTCACRNLGGDTCRVLDAGRANPNFLATPPREALAHLFFFACQWASGNDPARRLGFRHEKRDLTRELREYLGPLPGAGAAFLTDALHYSEEVLGFDPGPFVYELLDAALGDSYPAPPRILPFVERCVRTYLLRTLFGDRELPEGGFDLFATEGATAAIVDLFRSLSVNRLLKPGDRIAVITPIFPPYLEIPVLADYRLVPVHVEVDPLFGRHIPDSGIEMLKERDIKALFMVNPTNPTSTCLSSESMKKIGRLVREERDDLLVVTDAVYAAFTDGYHEIAAEIPHNTIVLFSFSKYFGATGWRLGVVMMHGHHVADRLIACLPPEERALAEARYSPVSKNPEAIRFIDRLAHDSRDVALAHTGGLSCPQQVLMCLFSLFGLMECNRGYRKEVGALLRSRKQHLYDGLELPSPEDPEDINFYVLLDILRLGEALYGKAFSRFLESRFSVEEFLFLLAKETLTLLLPGEGFAAPQWRVRVSLANLEDHAYTAAGRHLRAVLEKIHREWKAEKTLPKTD